MLRTCGTVEAILIEHQSASAAPRYTLVAGSDIDGRAFAFRDSTEAVAIDINVWGN